MPSPQDMHVSPQPTAHKGKRSPFTLFVAYRVPFTASLPQIMKTSGDNPKVPGKHKTEDLQSGREVCHIAEPNHETQKHFGR